MEFRCMSTERHPTPAHSAVDGAVRAGGFVFFSGIVASDASGKIIDGDIRVQTCAVLEHVQLTLRMGAWR